MLFRNARLILEDRILPAADLRVRDGVLSHIGSGLSVEAGEAVLDASGRFLAPGFVDMHIHGALGRDTMEASAEAFTQICRFHATGGTTSLALTTVSAAQESILAVLRAVSSVDPNIPGGARILGVHIEGPYFSPQKPGAHLPSMLRNPDPAEYREWLRYRDCITQITLAPELPGALECIEEMSGAGVIVSGGHSDAWDEEATAGNAHGMRQVTHTYNCMSSARRRGPYRVAGLLEFAMAEPTVLCELIADGHHVSPTLMRALYQAKGSRGIALVTDAGGGAGLPVGSSFRVGAIEAVVHPGISLTADGQALACSVARMNEMVRVLVEKVDIPLVEAVRMASAVPAAALGLEDTLGTLREGLCADLVLLDENLNVEMTFVAGQRVH